VKGAIIVKKYTHSVMFSEEEEQEWKAFIKQKRIETEDGNVSMAGIIREAIFKYIRNGKPDKEQDNKQEDNPTTPTETPTKNLFADMNF